MQGENERVMSLVRRLRDRRRLRRLMVELRRATAGTTLAAAAKGPSATRPHRPAERRPPLHAK